MIKIVAVFVVLCGISSGYSVPVRNAFMYYQQPMGYMGQRQAMYGLHYQNQQLRNLRRSAGVSAFAAGNNLAAGTYLKDVESAETPVQDPSIPSVADAYPAEQYPVEDIPAIQQDVPAVQEFDAVEPIADEPVAAPVVPAVIPEKKKKVTVQLDSAEEEEQDTQVGRRGGNRTAAPNAYFPVNFGSTNGGAIAIANSYSTGKGGSATSTATAYGSPATAELRRAAPVQLRKKPAKLRARPY